MTILRFLLPSVVLLVTAACTSPNEEAEPASNEPVPEVVDESTTVETNPEQVIESEARVSAECQEAFEQAAAVDEMQDTVADLYPAAKACATLEEWVAAARANPGAIDEGLEDTFARNVCLYGPDPASGPDYDPELATAPLCLELSD